MVPAAADLWQVALTVAPEAAVTPLAVSLTTAADSPLAAVSPALNSAPVKASMVPAAADLRPAALSVTPVAAATNPAVSLAATLLAATSAALNSAPAEAAMVPASADLRPAALSVTPYAAVTPPAGSSGAASTSPLASNANAPKLAPVGAVMFPAAVVSMAAAPPTPANPDSAVSSITTSSRSSSRNLPKSTCSGRKGKGEGRAMDARGTLGKGSSLTRVKISRGKPSKMRRGGRRWRKRSHTGARTRTLMVPASGILKLVLPSCVCKRRMLPGGGRIGRLEAVEDGSMTLYPACSKTMRGKSLTLSSEGTCWNSKAVAS